MDMTAFHPAMDFTILIGSINYKWIIRMNREFILRREDEERCVVVVVEAGVELERSTRPVREANQLGSKLLSDERKTHGIVKDFD
jgi:hypothetical protein